MDPSIQKALNDKLYDKRKSGALDPEAASDLNHRLEGLIRDCLNHGDNDRIAKIVRQLCHDFAYAVHQPHARNGGLIGLAAASIALGPEVARYLEEIIPPVLACFTDQDARVRYYACESMYNIAKVAKGEILLYFNPLFDALSKLAADSELSVKNGAELLDRLIKDIVAESASSYVSVLGEPEKERAHSPQDSQPENLTAFSLPRFIPLLTERITVINPYTRMFLVSWITLLDSIPDLELVAYLPSFLGGLFKFLSDSNQDVHTATQVCLDKFLLEIKKIARVKQGLALIKRSQKGGVRRSSLASSDETSPSHVDASNDVRSALGNAFQDEEDSAVEGTADSDTDTEDEADEAEEDWIPGQDVYVDHMKILENLVDFLGGSPEEEILLTALRWIDSFFDICPEDILTVVPRLLSQVLPAMSNNVEKVRRAASNVNTSLMDYILSLPDDESGPSSTTENQESGSVGGLQVTAADRRGSSANPRVQVTSNQGRATPVSMASDGKTNQTDGASPSRPESRLQAGKPLNLDYEATVNALTLQFLNEHENTRVAALNWLIMLQRKAPPGRQLEINDGTFPALLKTLSDMSDAVVTRDLLLLSQMFRNSDDSKFQSFMLNLLKLFSTDRRLLETRGNLIIRQLCVSLSAERVYRTLADCLEKDEDMEFASMMVQNLNNNLLTAPELAELRKRLRNLDTRDGQMFFVTLFKSWCHNAVATFSLCLLAQAYEQAYHLLQIFADLEMTVNILIQIDKLVQLLESPVFTYLRLQLLEPERFPHLYKCLYGLLMLLPQSSAFAALKNRLNSVSAIGYLHIAGGGPQLSSSMLYPFSGASGNVGPPGTIGSQATALRNTYVSSAVSNIHSRQKSSDTTAVPTAGGKGQVTGGEGPGNQQQGGNPPPGIRWVELLEKFRHIQERARRGQQVFLEGSQQGFEERDYAQGGRVVTARSGVVPDRPGFGLGLVEEHQHPQQQARGVHVGSASLPLRGAGPRPLSQMQANQQTQQAGAGRGKSTGSGNNTGGGFSGRFERLTGGVAGRKTKR